MIDIGTPVRNTLLCATMLSGIPSFGLGQAWAGVPFGVYLFVDTKSPTEPGFITPGSPISSLFGTVACALYPCTGGITGLFLSVPWKDFEDAPTSHGTTAVRLDHSNHLGTLLSNIGSIESAKSPFAFQLSLGLRPGENSAFDVLDMYKATGGSFPGQSPPGYHTTSLIAPDVLQCPFQTASGTISGSGGTLSMAGFPQQCIMGVGPVCIPQPRIWGNDASSLAANPLYIKAFVQAQQDLANFVMGVPGYQTLTTHDFQALKLSDITDFDAEISIAGNPHVLMPNDGMTPPTYFICGDPDARDAEEIWTKQGTTTGTGTVLAYETSVMESTWGSLLAASVSVTKASPYAGAIGYVVDVLAQSNFPPLQPKSCSTNCTYTAASSSLLPQLTTGEMEHLITNAIGSSVLSAGNLAIQDEGLEADQPDAATEDGYAITEIPCAMNAAEGTPIGYQSGGVTLMSGTDKLTYLALISNAVAYGAQYIELRPSNVGSFVANHIAVPFNGHSSYGTTDAQNIDMLSSTIQSALSVMATNQASSASGTLCPVPTGTGGSTGGPGTPGWMYPY